MWDWRENAWGLQNSWIQCQVSPWAYFWSRSSSAFGSANTYKANPRLVGVWKCIGEGVVDRDDWKTYQAQSESSIAIAIVTEGLEVRFLKRAVNLDGNWTEHAASWWREGKEPRRGGGEARGGLGGSSLSETRKRQRCQCEWRETLVLLTDSCLELKCSKVGWFFLGFNWRYFHFLERRLVKKEKKIFITQ